MKFKKEIGTKKANKTIFNNLILKCHRWFGVELKENLVDFMMLDAIIKPTAIFSFNI